MSAPAIVHVAMPPEEGGGYDAVIAAEGGAALLAELVAARFPDRARFLVADEAVARRHGAPVAQALGASIVTAAEGEAAKSLAEVERLAGALVDAGVDREALLFALGGGALGDVAGFVAATLLRGLDYVHLPTTLLAMVDSSIGGKTAVNLPRGKNLLGAFHQPRLVFCDLQTLTTLPARDRAAGLAEVLKHAMLSGEAELAAIEREAEALRDGPVEALAPIVRGAIAYKAQVVAADPRERVPAPSPTARPNARPDARPLPISGRITLNLGHSLGHAFERASHDTDAPLRHGEAVALGLYAEAQLGARLGLWPDGPARLAALLPRLGLSADVAGLLGRLSADVILSSLLSDKKRQGGRIRFVLLDAPGRANGVTLDGARAVEMLLDENRG